MRSGVHFVWFLVLGACFSEPETLGATQGADASTSTTSASQASDDSQSGSVGSTDDAADSSSGSTGLGSSSSTGGWSLAMDIYDEACNATWTDGDALPVSCTNPPMPGTPSSVGRSPDFTAPNFPSVRAVMMQPSADDAGYLQGLFVIDDRFDDETVEEFVVDAVCFTFPPAEPCSLDLQVRLLRGDESLGPDQTITITNGEPQYIALSFEGVVLQEGDELLLALFNPTDSGANESLGLIEPVLTFE